MGDSEDPTESPGQQPPENPHPTPGDTPGDGPGTITPRDPDETMSLLTLATWLKEGEASDSSGDGHYTTGAIIPGTSIKGVRFQPPDSAQRWLLFNNPNGGFSNWNEPTICITAMIHIASAPPSGGGDTVMDFKDAGSGSKLSVYAQDDGSLVLLDRHYEHIISGTQTGNLEGGTYWLQIAAGSGSSAPLRFKVYTLEGQQVFDSGPLTANLGTTNYALVQIGRTTTFNISPMDLYYGPLAIGSGTTPYPPAFRAGRQDPAAFADQGNWTGTIASLGDDNLSTRMATSSTNDELRTEVASRAESGINAASVLGVRLFARLDSPSFDGQAKIKLTSGSQSAQTNDFTMIYSNEAYSLVLDTDPATSAAWTPGALDTVEIGVISVSLGSGSEIRAAELALLSLYYPEQPVASTGGQRSLINTLVALGLLD
jgi:hypothetical protein